MCLLTFVIFSILKWKPVQNMHVQILLFQNNIIFSGSAEQLSASFVTKLLMGRSLFSNKIFFTLKPRGNESTSRQLNYFSTKNNICASYIRYLFTINCFCQYRNLTTTAWVTSLVTIMIVFLLLKNIYIHLKEMLKNQQNINKNPTLSQGYFL